MSRIWNSFRELYRNINKIIAQTKELEALKAKRARLQEDMKAFEGHKAASRAIDDARNLAIVRAAVTGAEQFDSKLKEQGDIFIAAQKEMHAHSQKEMERHIKDQEEQMGKIATRFAQSSAKYLALSYQLLFVGVVSFEFVSLRFSHISNNELETHQPRCCLNPYMFVLMSPISFALSRLQMSEHHFPVFIAWCLLQLLATLSEECRIQRPRCKCQ